MSENFPGWLEQIAVDWMTPSRAVRALRSRVFEVLDTGVDEEGYFQGIAFDPEWWAGELGFYSSDLEDVPDSALRLFIKEWRDEVVEDDWGEE